MAAKLLMKRFAIKDVSESLALYFGFFTKKNRYYLPTVLFSQVPSWMKNFDEDNDGRLNYREFKQVNLGSKMRSSLSLHVQSRPFSPQHQSQKLNQKVKTRRKKMQVKQLIDCLKNLLIHIYLSFVSCLLESAE